MRKKLMQSELNFDKTSSDESSASELFGRFEPPETQRYCQYCQKYFRDIERHLLSKSHQRNLKNN